METKPTWPDDGLELYEVKIERTYSVHYYVAATSPKEAESAQPPRLGIWEASEDDKSIELIDESIGWMPDVLVYNLNGETLGTAEEWNSARGNDGSGDDSPAETDGDTQF